MAMSVQVRTASINWWGLGWHQAWATSSSRICARGRSPGQRVRAYAYDVANLDRFLEEQRIPLTALGPMEIFAWVDWQGARRPASSGTVVRLAPSSAALDPVGLLQQGPGRCCRGVVLLNSVGHRSSGRQHGRRHVRP
jgi:hypothetical protein